MQYKRVVYWSARRVARRRGWHVEDVMPPCPRHAVAVVGVVVLQVGDFGVMRLMEHTTAMAETLTGTPYYVSPEICLGRPYSFESDVWSLGVMTYEMCALTVPFNAKDFKELRREIVQTKPMALSRCGCARGPSGRKLASCRCRCGCTVGVGVGGGYSLRVHCVCTACALRVHCLCTACELRVHCV